MYELMGYSYATRLPDIASSICHKLGAPSGPSPTRPKLTRVTTADRLQPPPTTVAQRQSRQKPRKTLERVLTDDKSSSRRPPTTLVRSATDSVLPRIKRETSSVSLSAIPLEKSNMAVPKRYSQREVDLTAVSQATEAKSQKKVAMEQEVKGALRGAIATLRKPNSRMAVKELVESAELRAAGAGSKSRSWFSLWLSLKFSTNPLQSQKTLFETLLLKVFKSWLRQKEIDTRTCLVVQPDYLLYIIMNRGSQKSSPHLANLAFLHPPYDLEMP